MINFYSVWEATDRMNMGVVFDCVDPTTFLRTGDISELTRPCRNYETPWKAKAMFAINYRTLWLVCGRDSHFHMALTFRHTVRGYEYQLYAKHQCPFVRTLVQDMGGTVNDNQYSTPCYAKFTEGARF